MIAEDYSPFRRDERDRKITEEDACRLLEGEPRPLVILVDIIIEE
jgi:hypothetical protein